MPRKKARVRSPDDPIATDWSMERVGELLAELKKHQGTEKKSLLGECKQLIWTVIAASNRESPSEARTALERLKRAAVELGATAEKALEYGADLCARHPFSRYSKGVEQLLWTIDGALLHVMRGRGRPRAKVRTDLAERLAIAYYEITYEMPPTDDPYSPTSRSADHAYHQLVREVFDELALPGWQTAARKASRRLKSTAEAEITYAALLASSSGLSLPIIGVLLGHNRARRTPPLFAGTARLLFQSEQRRRSALSRPLLRGPN
jgi:hypothetical protein